MDQQAKPLLSLDSLGKRFGSLQALEGVSLEVYAGTVQCLLGENGAGKSTLCNLIFGVYEPSVGSMTFDGAAWAGKPGRGAGAGHRHGAPAFQPGATHDRGREPD